jgi:alkylation response protein AidB-like acyl-CoA dehydrogenase
MGSAVLDGETVEAILREAGAMARDVLLPLDRTLDRQGARLDGQQVRTAEGHRAGYSTFAAGGWLGLSASEEVGGQALPQTIMAACQEFWHAGSMAFAMGNLLTIGAIETLHQHASADLIARYVPKLVSGEWSATMALTEPAAGSDLSEVRTRAEPAEDDSYLIRGNKIFISYGDHDLTDNIIHLVLARMPEAPAGSRGLSLFLVPKAISESDGRMIANDVRCIGLEEKLGQHGSPTCSMAFGEQGGAVGWVVGQPNRGLQAMFTMMNSARLAVAMQGVGVAERATQAAEKFAAERLQGIDSRTGRGIPIEQHPDVRRMLKAMRSMTTIARFLALSTADAIDRERKSVSASNRRTAKLQADILTPIAKGFCTQTGIDVADTAIQVHGGMGYIEETGVAQLWRDARVTSIYEGTNGIQAIDLIGRKLSGEGLSVILDLIDGFTRDAKKLALRSPESRMALSMVEDSLRHLRDCAHHITTAFAEAPGAALVTAAPFLRLAGLTIGTSFLVRAITVCEDEGQQARLGAILQFTAALVLPETMGLARLIVLNCSSELSYSDIASTGPDADARRAK